MYSLSNPTVMIHLYEMFRPTADPEAEGKSGAVGRGIQNDCSDYPRDRTLGRQLTMVRFGLYKIYPNVTK